MFDIQSIQKDFPLLKRTIHGKRIVYLDSSATSLKPQAVLDAMNGYYTQYTANVFRGIYTISEEATLAFENARQKVASFIHAPRKEEVVFTRNTSESLNLLSAGLGKTLSDGDEIVTTIMEHHSNFVPWQQLAQASGIVLRIWNADKDGKLPLSDLNKLITRKTKVLTFTAVSNMLGTINPVKSIISAAKKINRRCIIIVDAAQAVPHMPVDVSGWGADFVAFSSHKMLGPTGVGVLWGTFENLQKLPPYQYGGEMIAEVHVDRTVFQEPPLKFEAGTPDIAGVIGLGAAVDYLTSLGMQNVRDHEKEITAYALEALRKPGGITVLGPQDADGRGGVIAFTMEGVHPHDIAQVLDEDNVCIRAGHHCAMPLHEYYHVPATARASFSVYTSKEDIDLLVQGLRKAKKRFA
jgi:cysteine desulfurase/selenocysteine lyase